MEMANIIFQLGLIDILSFRLTPGISGPNHAAYELEKTPTDTHGVVLVRLYLW